MSDEQLTDVELDELIAALWISAPRSKSYAVACELKIARAEVTRLEEITQTQDEIIGDERRAHEVEIARLNELLGKDLRSTPYVEWKTG